MCNFKKVGVNLQCFVYYEWYGDQLGKFEKIIRRKKFEIPTFLMSFEIL